MLDSSVNISDSNVIDNNINYSEQDLIDHNGIAAIIWNETRDKILVFYHKKLGLWSVPTGKVDDNESIEKALKREVKEEVNIDIKDFKVIFWFKRHYLRCRRIVKIAVTGYEILDYSGNIFNNEPNKHSYIQFKSIEDIKKIVNLSDSTKEFLKLIKNNP